METGSARDRAANDTRWRILDVALEVLGQNPDAGWARSPSAAGVVRRTVYGHFPRAPTSCGPWRNGPATSSPPSSPSSTTAEPPRTQCGPSTSLASGLSPPVPVLLVSLRRGEYGEEIHALLRPVETSLATLVRRGQGRGLFGRHLPADILGQLAWGAVFTIADRDLADGARPATISTLLLLGVSEARAIALAAEQQSSPLRSEPLRVDR